MRVAPELTPVASLDRVMSHREVLAVTGWSRTTLWRQYRRQLFPQPIRTTARRIGWLESEVADWLDTRKAEREIQLKH